MLEAIENVPVHFYDKVMLGQPGRDEQMENYCATIRAVEMIRLEGRRKYEAGDAKNQHQVNPLHVYAEHRPAEYHERKRPAGEAKTSALYLRINAIVPHLKKRFAARREGSAT